MSYITERVAYLKGYAEGVKIDDKTEEGKVIGRMIEVLSEMAEYIDELEESIMVNTDAIDDLEDDVDGLYDLLDDECGCGCHDDTDLSEFGDEEFYQLVCPHCHQEVYFDDEMLGKDELICPNCHKEIEVDFEDDEEEEE